MAYAVRTQLSHDHDHPVSLDDTCMCDFSKWDGQRQLRMNFNVGKDEGQGGVKVLVNQIRKAK
jgi:hypothetical protein